jgi:hypothetical protein
LNEIQFFLLEKEAVMREWISYLGEIVLITAVSGLLYMFSPEGNLKKHLHFVISLCIVVSLAVPMFSMIMDLPEIFEKSFEEAERGEVKTNEDLTDSLISVSKKEIEKTISICICCTCHTFFCKNSYNNGKKTWFKFDHDIDLAIYTMGSSERNDVCRIT